MRRSSRSPASTRKRLRRAAADGELWRLWYTSVAPPEKMGEYIDDRARHAREARRDAVRRARQRERRHRRLHALLQRRCARTAGSRSATPGTQSARSAPRSTPSASCCCSRMRSRRSSASRSSSARTGSTTPSREAIARLGAKQDGVLRNHQVAPDGSYRDTVVFSIIESEWPAVKRHLTHLLERPRSDSSCHAHRLLPPPQGREAPGLHARVPDAARSARARRRVAAASTTSTSSRAPAW